MSLPFIRRTYGVPAFRGRKVVYSPPGKAPRAGVITSAKGSYLRIKFDGDKKTHWGAYHPTWKIDYNP